SLHGWAAQGRGVQPSGGTVAGSHPLQSSLDGWRGIRDLCPRCSHSRHRQAIIWFTFRNADREGCQVSSLEPALLHGTNG
ncbi:unnamed protein product, partial [Musa banksii]